MPWFLAPHLVPDKIEWRIPAGEARPSALDSPETPPREKDLQTIFTITVEESRDRMPDFSILNGNAGLVVSRRLRELIESMDPASHLYFAARIVLQDGRVIEDSHFLFKLADLIDDGLDPAQSTISPVIRGGEFRYYRSSSLTPNLMWRASKISGRHIWADKYLPSDIVVSDELYSKMKSMNMGEFISKESRVDANS